MKRIDVLKGIEQILVQKAYETGHISHRADGDWQKQADGSWKPYKGQSSQSAPQTQEPTENTEYGEITEEDLIETPEVDLYDDDQIGFSSYANNINIDGGVADNDDLEDVANQILLDNNLEVNDENMNKARNAMLSWLDTNGYLDEEEDQYDEITEEDLKVSTPIKNKLSKEEKSDINNKLYDVLSFYDSDSKELFGIKHIDGGGVDGSPNISYDWKTDKILPADKDKFDKVVRHYMDKADIEDTPLNYKQAYNTIKGMAINNGMLKTTNHPLDTADEETRNSWVGSEDQYGKTTEEDLKEDSNITNEEKTVVNPKMDWEGISMSSVDKPAQYILENLEDFEGEDMNGTIKTFVKGAGDREQQIIDTTKRYIQRQAESDGKRLTWYSDGTYSIEKSAFRDMRSIPVTKNMGF